jgi:hypothetical protein
MIQGSWGISLLFRRSPGYGEDCPETVSIEIFRM